MLSVMSACRYVTDVSPHVAARQAAGRDDVRDVSMSVMSATWATPGRQTCRPRSTKSLRFGRWPDPVVRLQRLWQGARRGINAHDQFNLVKATLTLWAGAGPRHGAAGGGPGCCQ